MTTHRRQRLPALARRGASPPRGLTLAELLVVLLVLAILATVAVQSLAPVVDQAKFEATQKSLAQIRAAIAGPDEVGATGDPVTGFVADMGRLPVSLDELLNSASVVDSSPFGLQAAPAPFGNDALSPVSIPRGWRGPYVRLPVGGTQLLDGWGQAFVFDAVSTPSGLSVASSEVNRPTQLNGYQQPLAISIAPTQWQATLVTGKLYALNSADLNRRIPPSAATWTVTLFGPGPASVNDGVAMQTVTQTTAGMTEPTFSFTSGLSIGPRAIRAARNGVPVGQTTFIVLRPGATHVVELMVE